ncbi:hypothetical protein [uncultured Porphyromonas sp.]|uniref:hypothetical protein n=1 Tax=uncultured Porphyromonas sp. TaxID=159274 RepID=UPI002635792A|nr:hypothetical protein [uncultured Porphyromonas sp.]
MKRILPLLMCIALMVSCKSSEPNPTECETYRATFTATPTSFPGGGGIGHIEGILEQIGSDGEVISQQQLKAEDFTISLKEGNASEITIDDAQKRFAVKEGSDEVDFILEAVVTEHPDLTQLITIHRESNQLQLPLAYVTEYNVNQAGDAFVTTHTNNTSGYFTFPEAVEKFASITIAGRQYHLPTIAEWQAIVPRYRGMPNFVEFDHDCDFRDIEETVMVHGTEISFTSDYYSASTGKIKATYAIRFKGTDLLSAWRYEYIVNPDDHNDMSMMMKITCRPISEDVSIEDVSQPEYWEPTAEDIVRIFPSCGWKRQDEIRLIKTSGYYWAVDQENDDRGWRMGYYSHCADSGNSNPKTCGFTIRLFK